MRREVFVERFWRGREGDLGGVRSEASEVCSATGRVFSFTSLMRVSRLVVLACGSGMFRIDRLPEGTTSCKNTFFIVVNSTEKTWELEITYPKKFELI